MLLFAILLTAALIGFQRFVVRRTDSIAISADSLHYRADLLTNLAVILAMLLVEATGWPVIDPLVGLGIVGLLLYSAFGVGRRALDMLMDRELPAESRTRIRKLALGHPKAHDVHDLRTRRAGSDVFIELHLELDGDLDLEQAHAITHEVEARIRAAFPEADILVHQEPAGLEDPRLDTRIAGQRALIASRLPGALLTKRARASRRRRGGCGSRARSRRSRACRRDAGPPACARAWCRGACAGSPRRAPPR